MELPTISDSSPEPVLEVTEEAVSQVESFRSETPEPDAQAMWVEITGEADGQYVSSVYLRARADAGPGDAVQQAGSLPVVVPADSIDKLRGATVDWVDADEQTGLLVRNPNEPPKAPTMLPMMPAGAPQSPSIAAPPSGTLSGEVAEQVSQVLAEQINPAIAAHGGRAELVAVEEGSAYLRLGGGCQGCGMASVTLTQGIEVAIREAVPEIERVVDVTDHAAGTNPYFEPAKK